MEIVGRLSASHCHSPALSGQTKEVIVQVLNFCSITLSRS